MTFGDICRTSAWTGVEGDSSINAAQTRCKLILYSVRTGFRFVPKSVTLNDLELERCNDRRPALSRR